MKLKYRYQDFQFGQYRLQIRIPINLDKVAEVEGSAPGISDAAFPLFGIVWASGELLARLMLDHDIEGKRILEVGCGLGLASHLLNLRGADITSLDIHPLAGDLMAANCVLNSAPEIPFVCSTWGEDQAALGHFDLVLASDVLYEPRHISTLAGFFDRHCAPGGEVIVVEPDRGQAADFLEGMANAGFDCRIERPEFEDHLGVPFSGAIMIFDR